MAGRHTSRQRAVQILYQWDMRGGNVEAAIASFYDSLYDYSESADQPAGRPTRDVFMEQLVHGTASNLAAIDRALTAKAAHWRVERMPVVDRNILRVAVYEMTELKAPPAVVIDEAIELARRFAGDESAGFVNGVLDAVRREQDASPDPGMLN